MKAHRYIPDRNRSFFAWQRPVLARALKFEDPAIYLDMRLGKSLVSIEYCIRKKLRRVLVLCPKTAMVSWRKELTFEKVTIYALTSRKLKLEACTSSQDGWYMASLATILTVPLHLANWDAIIIDESSRMKDPTSGTTKTLMKYYQKIPHKILLSGTPNPEGIVELVPQLIFKDGSCLGCKDFWHFRSRHMIQVEYDWVLRYGVYDQLKALTHKQTIFMSQKSAGWDTRETREKVLFKMNAIQIRESERILKHFELKLNNEAFTTKYAMTQSIWLSKIASGYAWKFIINKAKEDWMLEYLAKHKDEQVICWFRFNDGLRRIKKVLEDAGYRVAALYGTMTVDDRMLAQQAFQRGETDVMLLQTKIGQYSLDLHNASAAIYFTNSYSAEERSQSEKRISHAERISPPAYIDLLFEDSIEVDILEVLREKKFSFKLLWEMVLKRYIK